MLQWLTVLSFAGYPDFQISIEAFQKKSKQAVIYPDLSHNVKYII